MTTRSPLSPSIIYPELHAALGWGFVTGFLLYLPPSWFWPALGVLELVLLVKEAWFDPRFEGPTQPFLWEGVKDFLWYHAGYLLALLPWVLLHGVGRLPSL